MIKKLLKNKDFWFLAIFAIILVAAGVTFQNIAHAQFNSLQGIGEKANLPGGVATHGQSSAEPGAAEITSIIYTIVDVVKYFVGTLAIIWLIISGVRLVSAGEGIEKAAESQKKNIAYSIAALIIVILADQVVKIIFGENGGTFENATVAEKAAQQTVALIQGITGFITKFIAAIAVLMIIINGLAITFSMGSEESQKKYMKRILWALGSLVLVMIADFTINQIIFPNQGSQLPNIEKAKMLIIDMTNFITGFVGIAAVLIFIYSGFLYVRGTMKVENVKTAKTLMAGTLIGLVLMLGAFAIVHTAIKLDKVADSPAPIGTMPTGLGK